MYACTTKNCGGQRIVTYFRGVQRCVLKCHRGRGSKLVHNSATYFMDGPFVKLEKFEQERHKRLQMTRIDTGMEFQNLGLATEKARSSGMLILVLVPVPKDSLRTYFKSLPLSWSWSLGSGPCPCPGPCGLDVHGLILVFVV